MEQGKKLRDAKIYTFLDQLHAHMNMKGYAESKVLRRKGSHRKNWPIRILPSPTHPLHTPTLYLHIALSLSLSIAPFLNSTGKCRTRIRRPTASALHYSSFVALHVCESIVSHVVELHCIIKCSLDTSKIHTPTCAPLLPPFYHSESTNTK